MMLPSASQRSPRGFAAHGFHVCLGEGADPLPVVVAEVRRGGGGDGFLLKDAPECIGHVQRLRSLQNVAFQLESRPSCLRGDLLVSALARGLCHWAVWVGGCGGFKRAAAFFKPKLEKTRV